MRDDVGARPTVDPVTAVQLRIGVMGSEGGESVPGMVDSCQRPGRDCLEADAVCSTGACPGVPHEVVLGAKSASGHVVGILPAVSLKEHVERYGSPYQEYDVLIFTGLGLMGRELVNIHSSDIVIVAVAVQERSGSLRSRMNTAGSLAC